MAAIFICMYVYTTYSCKGVIAIIGNSCEVLEYNIYYIQRLLAYKRTLVPQGDLSVQVIVETFEKLVMSALRQLCMCRVHTYKCVCGTESTTNRIRTKLINASYRVTLLNSCCFKINTYVYPKFIHKDGETCLEMKRNFERRV